MHIGQENYGTSPVVCGRRTKGRRCSLSLSCKPLFALRIDFRECETLDFGTARTMDGNSSSNEASIEDRELGRVNGGELVRASPRSGRVAKAGRKVWRHTDSGPCSL